MNRFLRVSSVLLSAALLAVIAVALRGGLGRFESVRLVETTQDLERYLKARAAEPVGEETPLPPVPLPVVDPSPAAEAVLSADVGAGSDVAAYIDAGVASAEAPAVVEAARAVIPWQPLKRVPIGPDVAAMFYPSLSREVSSARPRKVYDPRAYFINAPGWKAVITFAEHSRRQWEVGYSQSGHRNPYEPADPSPAHRVILCGDSHMEGVVPQEETTAALLERGLRLRLESRSVEVLNGASGGYDFYNYVGYFERSLALAPQVFVLVIYGGNDFVGQIGIHAYFERLGLDLVDPQLQARMRAGAEVGIGLMAQGFHQVSHFKARPVHAELALDAAVRAMRDIDALARRAGVVLVTAYLPPQHDARPQDMLADVEAATRIFELDEADLQLTDRLADRFLAELALHGIETVDLRPAIRAGPRRMYWRDDHHLNSHGHLVVARELLPHVLEKLRQGH